MARYVESERDAGAHEHGIGVDQTSARGLQGMRYGEREERATVTLSSCVCKASMALGAAAKYLRVTLSRLRLPRLNAPVTMHITVSCLQTF